MAWWQARLGHDVSRERYRSLIASVSEAIQLACARNLDCFVAVAPRNDESRQPRPYSPPPDRLLNEPKAPLHVPLLLPYDRLHLDAGGPAGAVKAFNTGIIASRKRLFSGLSIPVK